MCQEPLLVDGTLHGPSKRSTVALDDKLAPDRHGELSFMLLLVSLTKTCRAWVMLLVGMLVVACLLLELLWRLFVPCWWISVLVDLRAGGSPCWWFSVMVVLRDGGSP